MGTNPMAGVLLRRGEDTRNKVINKVKMKAEIGMISCSQGTPRFDRSPQKVGRGEEAFFPGAFSRSMAMTP